MTADITEYTNVRRRLQELGCNDPSAFALLPINFETAGSIADFRLASETATVKTLLRSADLSLSDIFPPGQRPPYVVNHSIDWVAPTLFVSAALISQNPNYIAVALGVIANYVTFIFRGIGGEKKVTLDIAIEKGGGRLH